MVGYLYVLWVFVVLDIHRLLGEAVHPLFHRTLTVLFIPLLVGVVLRGPAIIHSAGTRTIYAPLLLYVGIAVLGVPLAANIGVARSAVEVLILYYLLALGTTLFLRSARELVPIVLLLVYQFVLWAVYGGTKGLVEWHPYLSNYNDFAAVLLLGLGACYYFGFSTQSTTERWVCWALAAYCVVGIVASSARGAVLAAGLLAVYMWFRSDRKLASAVGIVVGAAVLVVSSNLLFSGGAYWRDISSAFTQGTTEGTGADRWTLWSLAARVFVDRPILGVGAENFGVYASGMVRAGEIAGYTNPGWLWGRSLHNAYFQVLSELGSLGVIAFAWVIADFFRRIRELRSRAAQSAWVELTGGRYELRYVATALEAMMVGWLLVSLVYSTLYYSWLYTLLGATVAVHTLTFPSSSHGAHTGRLRWRKGVPQDGVLKPGMRAPASIPTPYGTVPSRARQS